MGAFFGCKVGAANSLHSEKTPRNHGRDLDPLASALYRYWTPRQDHVKLRTRFELTYNLLLIGI